jgi:membrane associated rhomboid family serine protease
MPEIAGNAPSTGLTKNKFGDSVSPAGTVSARLRRSSGHVGLCRNPPFEEEGITVPIGDQSVVKDKVSWVTYALLAINIIVFLVFQLPRMGDQAAFQSFVETFGAVPAQLQQGEALYSIITSMFLHGGWMHLISNMLFPWVFGDNIELVMGHIPFLILYLLGGIVATLAHVMFNWGSDIPSVGASGAISAVRPNDSSPGSCP